MLRTILVFVILSVGAIKIWSYFGSSTPHTTGSNAVAVQPRPQQKQKPPLTTEQSRVVNEVPIAASTDQPDNMVDDLEVVETLRQYPWGSVFNLNVNPSEVVKAHGIMTSNVVGETLVVSSKMSIDPGSNEDQRFIGVIHADEEIVHHLMTSSGRMIAAEQNFIDVEAHLTDLFYKSLLLLKLASMATQNKDMLRQVDIIEHHIPDDKRWCIDNFPQRQSLCDTQNVAMPSVLSTPQ